MLKYDIREGIGWLLVLRRNPNRTLQIIIQHIDNPSSDNMNRLQASHPYWSWYFDKKAVLLKRALWSEHIIVRKLVLTIDSLYSFVNPDYLNALRANEEILERILNLAEGKIENSDFEERQHAAFHLAFHFGLLPQQAGKMLSRTSSNVLSKQMTEDEVNGICKTVREQLEIKKAATNK